MKSKNCSHDVEDSDEYCKMCGAEVVLKYEMKKCPNCKDLQNPDVLFCTKCQIKLKICVEKKKDGSSCEAFIAEIQNFCTGCGKPVKKDADEIDGSKKTQGTQTIDGCKKTQGTQTEVIAKLGSPTKKKTEPGDVASGNNSHSADGPKVDEEMVNKAGQEDPRKTEEALPARALAVICTHTIFDKKLARERQSGYSDREIMEKTWKSYDDCEVLSFINKTNSFYEEDLAIEIQTKLDAIKNVKYFVFVLSTHGQENNEKGTMKHYFYTKDGQFQTQDLMTKISTLKGIDGRMKMFFIQACRSRATNSEQDNLDQGFNVEYVENNNSSSEKITESNEVMLNTKVTDVPDAVGEYTDYNEQFSEEENLKTIEIIPAEEIPHCDDCVVVFASMTGKYAYSRLNDHLDDGGWMIRALQSTLDQYQKGDHVHILDILTEINRKVSKKLLCNPLGNNDRCLLHLDLLKKEIEKKQDLLKKEIEKKGCKSKLSEESLTKLKELSNKVDKLQLNYDFSQKDKDEINDITRKVERIVGTLALKAQSCFFHNLIFEDEDITLQKT